MERFTARSVGIPILLVIALSTTQLPAEEISFETLVDSLPILSTSDDCLNSFQFTFETLFPFGVPVVVDFVWARPDDFGMLIAAGEERAPLVFLAGKKSLTFDVTTRTALLVDDHWPRFVVGVDENNWKFEYSVLSQKESEVAVDLPAFLRGVEGRKVEQVESGRWRLTGVSKSGKSKVIALFENSEGVSIRSLEIRGVEDDVRAMSIRNIAINPKETPVWPAFPAKDAFPEGLKVVRFADLNLDFPSENGKLVAFWLRAYISQGGLWNSKWRASPFLGDVDWDEAKKANAELGPALRALLKAPTAESTKD